MPKLPGINHLRAVAALEKAGFRILRQGAHIVMTDGSRILTIPRHNPVNAFTMGGIITGFWFEFGRFSKPAIGPQSSPDSYGSQGRAPASGYASLPALRRARL